MTASRSRPRSIGLLLYPGCMPAGLLSTADLLRAVNRRSGREVFEVSWLGLTRRPLTTQDGLELVPRQTLAESRCDVCLVPGFWTESEDDVEAMLERQAELIAALREAPGEPALWSYCAGVALAAAAGRLDGKAATGTWWLQRAFQRRFTRTRWRFAEPLVSDRGVVTAAGAQGHLLLVSEQLSRWVSPEVMRDVEHLLMLPRPPLAHPAFRPVELMAQPSPSCGACSCMPSRCPPRSSAWSRRRGIAPCLSARCAAASKRSPACRRAPGCVW